jgi:SAM-dependent methyltransferase
MRNKENWKPTFYKRDGKGRVQGTHMHKIIGNAYENVIRTYSRGILVDVGCGDVPYYMIYRDLIEDNICIDWAGEGRESPFLDKTADLNQGIPLDGGIADTVLCTDVLEHIHNPELLFSEMARIMKNGGKLVLTVPFMYWIHNAPHDYHRYTKYMLEEFCRRNDMKVITLEAYGGYPEIIYDLIHKGYIFYNFPLRRLFLAFWESLGLVLYRKKSIRRLSMASRKEFPLGYILVAEK